MGTAKDIVLRQIDTKTAGELVRRVHYSGISAINPYINIGCFYHGVLEGVLQFGPSLAKRKIQGLVKDTLWHEFIELNRMAFTDNLPRNSESRALSISMNLLRKYAPQLKWVISYADASQCGDGTIYRASGFVLTGITENTTLYKMPDGFIFADIGLRASSSNLRKKVGYKLGEPFSKFKERVGATKVIGYQIRYIYFLDPSYRARLTVPELPYSEIERRGAGMYKGIKRGTGETDSAAQTNVQTGGASPTVPLLNPVIQAESG